MGGNDVGTRSAIQLLRQVGQIEGVRLRWDVSVAVPGGL